MTLFEIYTLVLFGIMTALAFVTAEYFRRRLRNKRQMVSNIPTLFARILQLEEDMKYWKEAHIKLQGQMIRGRKIMYDRMRVDEDTQFEEESVINDDSIYTKVKCQQCNKNDVIIQKDAPYFGIICKQCRDIESHSWVKKK